MRDVLTFDPAAAFTSAFDAEIADIEEATPGAIWSSAGKPTKEHPGGEDSGWWRAKGPTMVEQWIAWRQKSDWDVWTLPNDNPAIEVEVQPTFGGILHRMIIDRVMETPRGDLVVVDLKSGRQMPVGDLQLGMYAAGLRRVFGVKVSGGAYWDARKAELSPVKNLDRYTPELLDAYAERFLSARRAGLFLPNVTIFCRGCGMAKFCAAVGGSQRHVDPDNALMKGSK